MFVIKKRKIWYKVDWNDVLEKDFEKFIFRNLCFSHRNFEDSNYTIPQQIRHLEDYYHPSRFDELGSEELKVEFLDLPPKLESIGISFLSYLGLKEIKIPNSVSIIKEKCFQWCTNLSKIELPHYLRFLDDSTFRNCLSLQSISLPSTITRLDTSCFDNCHNLSSISFPSSLKEIGNYCFRNCDFQTLIIPETVTKIGVGSLYEIKTVIGNM